MNEGVQVLQVLQKSWFPACVFFNMFGQELKMSESQTSAGNQSKCQESSVKCQMSIAYVDPLDMLNNFCFHVYAQKCPVVS